MNSFTFEETGRQCVYVSLFSAFQENMVKTTIHHIVVLILMLVFAYNKVLRAYMEWNLGIYGVKSVNKELPEPIFITRITYKDCVLRTNNVSVPTGYMAVICSIEMGDPPNSEPQLCFELQDISGRPIRLAIWREIAQLIDIEGLRNRPHKLVAAFAS